MAEDDVVDVLSAGSNEIGVAHSATVAVVKDGVGVDVRPGLEDHRGDGRAAGHREIDEGIATDLIANRNGAVGRRATKQVVVFDLESSVIPQSVPAREIRLVRKTAVRHDGRCDDCGDLKVGAFSVAYPRGG
ncbi:MAG: hypothetical protein C4346_10745 [Chloroflexota bacterium]